MSKLISILFFILFLKTICLFDNAPNMEFSLDAVTIYDKIVKNKKLSLVLIYSEGCPHCRKFEPDYIKLAQNYYSVADFYLLPSKSNFKKKFNIKGVPTMFFFDGKKFIEHKGLNNYEIIIHILENDYLKKCKEVGYDFLFDQSNNNSILYNHKLEEKLIISYFPNDIDFYDEDENDNKKINQLIRKKAFDTFLNKTHQIISLIDNCYYIRDINKNDNNNTMLNEGTIIAISKAKGINIFKGYEDLFLDNEETNEKYYEDRINDTGENYIKFLYEKIKDDYIEVTDSRMDSKLVSFIKRNVVFFVYKYENERKEYINQISSLIAMTKNDKYPLFDYVLFKYGCDIYRISYYFKSSGIYYSDKKLTRISRPNNLNIIIEMINTQNNYEYNEKHLEEIMNLNSNNTNNNTINKTTDNNKYMDKEKLKKEELYYETIKKKIIENQLETYLNDIPEEKMFSWENIKSAIFFLICLIGYSFAFDYLYKKYYPGKSIFNIFNEFIDCLNLIFCYDDDEEIDIEEKQIKIKNKKIDDINEEKPKYIKVQFK